MTPETKASLLYELELNGFVVLRSFLPVDLIDALYEEVRPILEGAIRRLAKGDQSELRGANRICLDLPPFLKALGGGPLEDARFRRNPLVEEIADAVLGKWRYGVTKAECPLPGSQHMSWHPDSDDEYLERPVRTERFTFNVPLGDVNDSNAPLEIVPGSHRMHHHRLRQIYSIGQVYSVRVLTRRGDCILRDGNALHRGTPNLTDRPRIMLDQTYRAASD